MPNCDYCNNILSNNQSLKRHHLICKKKNKFIPEIQLQTQKEQYETQLLKLENNLFTQREQYETQLLELQNQLQTQKEQYEIQLQTQREQYENQLQTQLQNQLQTQRELYENQLQMQQRQIEKLETQIFEIAKQPKENHIHNTTKSTTTHNEKILNIINQLSPMNFDQDTTEIEEMLKIEFTEKVFFQGPKAIVQIIIKNLLMDPETSKFKLICVDGNRKHFKYVDAITNQVMTDYSFQRFHEWLKNPLEKANYSAFMRCYEKNGFKDKYICDIREQNEEFIQSRNQLSDKIISEITKQ